jgi:hypothetical protein
MVKPLGNPYLTRARTVATLLALSLCSCFPVTPEKQSIKDDVAQENGWGKIVWDENCIQVLPDGLQRLSAGKSCLSVPTNLQPGHYEVRVTESHSREALKTLTVLPYTISSESSGEPILIPIEAKHPKKKGKYSFFSVRHFGIFDPKSSSLYPPHYPYDGGWLPETPAGFRFEVNARSEITFKEIEIRRSKFNQPLVARIRSTSTSARLPGELKEIAVNLQGSSSDQLSELQEARKSWTPAGPVLVISQIAPEDSTPTGLSHGSLQVLKELKSWSEQSNQIRFGVSLNTYLNNHHKGVQTRFFDGSTLEDVKKILQPFLAKNVHLVLLRTDDFTPSVGATPYDYGLADQRDRKTFKTLAKAHLALIKEVQKVIHDQSPHTQLAFVPPWYATSFVHNSPKRGSAYLKELSSHLNKSVPIVWTGPVVRSLWIDDDSLEEFRKLTFGHPLMLWDNTPYARAHKDFWLQDSERILSCSLLEPYDIPITTHFFSPTPFPQILVNTGINPINRIQLETTQRYISDPSKYHPEEILWSVLVSRFGAEYARLLLELDRNFWIAYKNLKESNSVGVTLYKDKISAILEELDNFSTIDARSTSEKLRVIITGGLRE